MAEELEFVGIERKGANDGQDDRRSVRQRAPSLRGDKGALEDLHADGTITLYADAVIAKDADGNTTVKQAADQEPLGTAVGLVTGSLVGLLGGPVGVLVGATTGMAGGALFDVGTTGVGTDFLAEAAESLQAGKAALVAEIEEEWVLPLDSRMEALGGTVFRRTRGEVTHA